MLGETSTRDTPPTRETSSVSKKVFARLARVITGPAGPYVGVGTVLVAMVVFLSMTQDHFLTSDNVLNILQTNSVVLVVSLGLTVVLLVGGFDLSVGAVLGLSGVCLAKMVTDSGVPAPTAIAIVIIGGILVGCIANGLPIAKLSLSFFVVTIATMSIFRGLALVVTGGQSQQVYDNRTLYNLGTGELAGVSYLIVIALAVFATLIVVTRYTGYGRMLYAVGGNSEAARLAGIRITPVRVAAYGICAGLAALAGVMQTAQLTTAEPTAATGIELTAAAAVLLGGTSFAGGSGTMLGTLLGTLFLGVLSNGLTLSGVSAYWQGVVSGTVLLIAVLADHVRASARTPTPIAQKAEVGDPASDPGTPAHPVADRS